MELGARNTVKSSKRMSTEASGFSRQCDTNRHTKSRVSSCGDDLDNWNEVGGKAKW